MDCCSTFPRKVRAPTPEKRPPLPVLVACTRNRVCAFAASPLSAERAMHTKHVSSLNEGESPPSTSGQQAKDPGHAAPLPPYKHRFTHRDVILYHLGLGASLEEKGAMQLLYEGAGLQVLPTYAIVAAHPAIYSVPLMDYLPSMNPAKALHGEQYVELLAPLPPGGTLITRPQVLSITDKGPGKGSVVVVRMESSDERTGQLVVRNEFVIFVMGAGGCNYTAPAVSRPAAATASNDTPSRPPDATIELQTSSNQAALYRLSGDYNPLHIDPKVAASAGFPRPILHGLCTLGMSVKAILTEMGALPGSGGGRTVKSVKARFAKHVFPGEALLVHMWRVGPDRVVFTTEVKDRPGTLAVTAAAVELQPTPKL